MDSDHEHEMNNYQDDDPELSLYMDDDLKETFGNGNFGDGELCALSNDCNLCKKALTNPVILACLHRFDLECLHEFRNQQFGQELVLLCPKCQTPTVLNPLKGLNSLSKDYLYLHELETNSSSGTGSTEEDATVKCGGCTTGAEAVAKCSECADFLCATCQSAHSVMKMFSTHHVEEITKDDISVSQFQQQKPLYCVDHPHEQLKYFCSDCGTTNCSDCLPLEHKHHHIDKISEVSDRIAKDLSASLDRALKAREIWETERGQLDDKLEEVHASMEQNEGAIKEAVNSYKAFIDDIGERYIEENKSLHSNLEMKIMDASFAASRTIEQMEDTLAFISAYLKKADRAVLVYARKTMTDWLSTLLRTQFNTQVQTSIPFDIQHNLKTIIENNFGSFGSAHYLTGRNQSTPSSNGSLTSASLDHGHSASAGLSMSGHSGMAMGNDGIIGDRRTAGPSGDSHNHHPFFASHKSVGSEPMAVGSSLISVSSAPNLFGGLPGLPAIATVASAISTSQTSPNAPGSDSGLSNSSEHLLSSMLSNRLHLDGSGGASTTPRTVTPQPQFPSPMDFSSTSPILPGVVNQPLAKPGALTGYNPNPNPPFPNRTGRCNSMTVRHRWGSLGSARGQFNSPHGFCLGFDEDIVVADTQNHRIQIFDKMGEHKFTFGVPGREEGQLWYPRKVAVMRQSGKFIVCDRGSERSRMQIFNRNGHFIKKITVRYIDIVAGLAINNQQHIVSVDSVSPTVFVIAENGELVKWFDCSNYMREPSDIAIQGREYFICDFKGHCVSVFQEDGVFLRRIGSESITNFPNGIDISDHGDVLIGDSHGNKFHVAVFNKSGQLTSEFECPTVKVSRCCGLKITSEGYVVTLAKNNHHVLVLNTLYIN